MSSLLLAHILDFLTNLHVFDLGDAFFFNTSVLLTKKLMYD